MDFTLKIANVLSDPTRYNIYQYVARLYKAVTVQEIAQEFSIHPNVARMHLSKLEDVRLLLSENDKSGRGGRPSRMYRLSDEVIQFHVPFRDYQLLSSIALETILSLGAEGRRAFAETGERYGEQLIAEHLKREEKLASELTVEEGIALLQVAFAQSGLASEVEWDETQKAIFISIRNCPFKEVARQTPEVVCGMHIHFIHGVIKGIWASHEFATEDNMLAGCCGACKYIVLL
ncbi:MAG: helix-turn-helix transcriptional regulator [Bacilli bacterium]